MFRLRNCHYADMSPVVIPPGYTRKYLDGEITFESQLARIQRSFARITAANDVRRPSGLLLLVAL